MTEIKEKEEVVDIVENSTIRLKSLLGGAGVIIAAIATGAMEFKDIRNSIDNIREDKLTAVGERYDRMKETMDRHYEEFREFKTETVKAISDNEKEQVEAHKKMEELLRSIETNLVAMENNSSRLRLSLSQLETLVNREGNKTATDINSINERLSVIKSDVMTLLIKSKQE